MIPIDTYEYLKEHIGCKWSVAEFEVHKRKWSLGPKLTIEDINSNQEINCCQELPNEITLESDYKDKDEYKNQENQMHAEIVLQQNNVGYYISSHKGKSDYIRFRFKTSKEITPKLRLAIIRYLAKPGFEFDENFFSIKYVRPVPGMPHWKHSLEFEKVIKEFLGQELDIDKLGIIEVKKPTIIRSGSMPFFQPVGWALSINIKTMAQRKGWLNCPVCNEEFEFNERLGWFKCSCSRGGIKKFVERHTLKIK